MQSLVDHARDFPSRVAAREEERRRFGRLADGQSPDVLFITCSDSRVVPSLITGAQPGQLFELRTAGNAVPPYEPGARPSAEAATVEYAVCVLGVPDVVVCGHSHCGAVGARLRGDDLAAVPHVRGWVHAQIAPPAELVRGPARPVTGQAAAREGADLVAAVQRHVRLQLDRLRGYPCVRERLADGRLRLHGWFYAVDTGRVLAHDPASDAFGPL